MDWWHALAEAILALRYYWRRSLVTLMSLAWGVCCFAVLISYGQGFERALLKAFHAVGQHLVVMYSGQTSRQAGGLRAGRRVQLEYRDAEVLKHTVSLVAAVSPERMVWNARISRGNYQGETTIRSVWPEYDRIRNLRVSVGRWLNASDNAQRLHVAVLGAEVAAKVFRGGPAIGEVIKLNGVRFVVVGVLERKLQIANYSRRDNDCVFIPYDTARVFGDVRYPHFIVWKPVHGNALEAAVGAVRGKLAELHKFSPLDDKAVEILPFDQFLHLVTGMSVALQLLLGLVGALTLGIGGVGLANMMLASVVHRTREIGTLRALGATREVVWKQFLLEAGVLVLAGGLVGLVLSAIVTYAIGSLPFLGPLFKDQSGAGDIRLQLSGVAVATSVAVLVTTGLVAALVPAVRASRLEPVEALRHE